MAMFGATLTLPGMAGIVPTVGMAVDANVIITERIKRTYKSWNVYSKSNWRWIFKCNESYFRCKYYNTFSCNYFYAYGTGPIKGFAITISIGILASMLTAILGTHGIYEALLWKKSKDKDSKKWFGLNNGNF